MKWTMPKWGDKRIITCFLWWPRTIAMVGETRWLETVRIEQEYRGAGWTDNMFLDESPEGRKGE